MDDGSRNSTTSAEMLRNEKKQGIELTALTSHYYKTVESPESFVKRREESFGKLMSVYDEESMPTLILGGEIEMYRGMSDDDLSLLCLGSTNILLCEMPTFPQPYTYEELSELVCQGYVPMIAHYERYFPTYKENDLVEILGVQGCIFQINISSLSKRRVREKIFKLAEQGLDFVLGTDTHNLTSRPPYIDRSPLSGRPSKKFKSSVENTEQMLFEALKLG
jgi:protein-tyrosine phosphatase